MGICILPQSEYLHRGFPGHIICQYLYLLDNINQIAVHNCCTNFPSQQHFNGEGRVSIFLHSTSNWYCQIFDSIWWVWQSVLFSKFALISENTYLWYNYWLLGFFCLMICLFMSLIFLCCIFLVFILLICRNFYPVMCAYYFFQLKTDKKLANKFCKSVACSLHFFCGVSIMQKTFGSTIFRFIKLFMVWPFAFGSTNTWFWGQLFFNHVHRKLLLFTLWF